MPQNDDVVELATTLRRIAGQQTQGLEVLADLVESHDSQLAADVRDVQARLRTALRLEVKA